jgi:hypothetical protein
MSLTNTQFYFLFKRLLKILFVFISGTGPHYLDEGIARQSKGLIFSYNLGIGVVLILNKSTF